MAPTTRRTGRTSVKGKHRVEKKYKRRQFDYKMKLDAINYLSVHGMKATIARFFDTTDDAEKCRLRVQKWKGNREYIEAACVTPKKAARMRVHQPGVGPVLPADVEDQLCKWIDDLRHDGVPIATSLLTSHALEITSEHGFTTSQFRASKSWRTGFLKRHKLSFRSRTHQGQQTVAEADKIADEFAADVRREIAAKGIVNVLNADQTAAFFEVLPKKTLAPTGTRTVWVRCGKKEKQRATVMLTGDITGKKYVPFIVFKTQPSRSAEVDVLNQTTRHGFGRYLWRQMEPCQSEFNVQIYGNMSAWWNEDLTLRYLDFMFHDRCPTSSPIMLLLDQFSGHWTDAVEARAKSYAVVLKKIPAGLTWRSQPADVAWIKPFKDSLRRVWVQSLRVQLAEHKRLRPQTIFSLQPPSRADIVRWVRDSWDGVTERTITAGFKKCMYTEDSSWKSGTDEDESVGGENEEDVSDVVVALESHGDVVGRPLTPDMDVIDNKGAEVDEE
ncbi:hypothetical protein P43SY_002555 [Pythium insidiosum]|uniref:HTH CENPB-type domain-containing protein n=1 Tax=Pythium insidiosum TaxID=114742 RepID=A0AAD5MC48_PYTIN|nr:hypothetical protein P43SY_002555 [Pythium insidiosum]